MAVEDGHARGKQRPWNVKAETEARGFAALSL
jgi:hypothetical protein